MAFASALDVRYRLVVALAPSEYAEIVLEHALDQVARHDAVDLHALTVCDAESEIPAAQAWLAAAVVEGLEAFGQPQPDQRTRLHVRTGVVPEEIANLAAELQADLLVIGRFGVGQRRGSVADRVLARAECPLLVVGLSGREAPSQVQCAACVAVRAETGGECWFCDAHVSEAPRLTILVPPSTMLGSRLW